MEDNDLEAEAVRYFVKLLESFPLYDKKPTHHVKLFDALLKNGDKNMVQYFQNFGDSQKYKFFRENTEFFNMNSGYVSLKPLLKKNLEYKKSDAKFQLMTKNIFCFLPADIDLNIDLTEAHSVDKANAEKQIVKYFISVLQDEGESHYLKLAYKLQHSNLMDKEHFLVLQNVEKLYFFKKHADDFDVSPDGFVTLSRVTDSTHLISIEEKAVQIAEIHLQIGNEMHFEKLIAEVMKSSVELKDFFTEMSTSKKFEFFKDYPLHFAILANGYVALALINESGTTASNKNINLGLINSEQKELVTEQLVAQLQIYGAVHFEKLAKLLDEGSSGIKGVLSSLSTPDLFTFFQKHPAFCIHNDSYVTLCNPDAKVQTASSLAMTSSSKKTAGSDKPSAAEMDSSANGISNPATLDEISYIEMPKNNSLELSQHDGDKSNNTSNCGVSSNSGSDVGENLSRVSEQPAEIHITKVSQSKRLPQPSGESIVMHYIALHLSEPMHYTKVLKCLNNKHPAILQLFSSFQFPTAFSVFNSHKEFCMKKDGILSSKCDVSNSFPDAVVFVKGILDDIISALKCDSIHYLRLVNHVRKKSSEVDSYFSHFSISGIYWFFKNQHAYFVVDGNTFDVSLSKYSLNLLDVKEKRLHSPSLMLYLINQLKTHGKMDCTSLLKGLKKSELHFNGSFQDLCLHSLLQFFMHHAAVFEIQENATVSLISGEDCETTDLAKITNFQDGLIESLCSFLQFGPLPLEEVTKCIKGYLLGQSFFAEWSTEDVVAFFHIHLDKFCFDNTAKVVSLCLKGCSQKSETSKTCHLVLNEKNSKQPDVSISVSQCISLTSMTSNSLPSVSSGSPGNIPKAQSSATCDTYADRVRSYVPKISKLKCDSTTKQLKKKEILAILSSHLRQCKSAHFEKLCMATDQTVQFFKSFTVSEKFKFFKESDIFIIGNDGYVMLPETDSNCTKNVEKDLVKIFVKLTSDKKRSFVGLKHCAIAYVKNWDGEKGETIQRFLQESSNEDIRRFVTSRPQHFLIINGRFICAKTKKNVNSNFQDQQKSDSSSLEIEPSNLPQTYSASVQQTTSVPLKSSSLVPLKPNPSAFSQKSISVSSEHRSSGSSEYRCSVSSEYRTSVSSEHGSASPERKSSSPASLRHNSSAPSQKIASVSSEHRSSVSSQCSSSASSQHSMSESAQQKALVSSQNSALVSSQETQEKSETCVPLQQIEKSVTSRSSVVHTMKNDTSIDNMYTKYINKNSLGESSNQITVCSADTTESKDIRKIERCMGDSNKKEITSPICVSNSVVPTISVLTDETCSESSPESNLKLLKSHGTCSEDEKLSERKASVNKAPRRYYEILNNNPNLLIKPSNISPRVMDGRITPVLNSTHLSCEESKELALSCQKLANFFSSCTVGSSGSEGSSCCISQLKNVMQSVAHSFNPELEKRCLEFIRGVLMCEANPVPVSEILSYASGATPDIQTYLQNYVRFDESLFFYMHLDYFIISPENYVSLRRASI